MLLTELDGFLTGVLLCPETIAPDEWLPIVWGADESGDEPFDDPADMRWFADAVMARHNEIARDLGRGKLQPIFDIDERNGDVLWEFWLDGFVDAMTLRPDSWAAIIDDEDAAGALVHLNMLIAVARNESALDSLEINAVHDTAPADLVADVLQLRTWRVRHRGVSAATSTGAPLAKVGRNDPCPCGSRKKFKRCCG